MTFFNDILNIMSIPIPPVENYKRAGKSVKDSLDLCKAIDHYPEKRLLVECHYQLSSENNEV